MGYKLKGESLEYAALHLSGAEVAQGGMALLVTATSAPDATVLSWHLAKAYNPGGVVGDDGSSATFRMDFRNKLETNFAYSDMQGAIGLYRQGQASGGSGSGQGNGSGGSGSSHGTPTHHATTQMPEPTQTEQPATDATTVIVVAAAIIALVLLWKE